MTGPMGASQMAGASPHRMPVMPVQGGPGGMSAPHSGMQPPQPAMHHNYPPGNVMIIFHCIYFYRKKGIPFQQPVSRFFPVFYTTELMRFMGRLVYQYMCKGLLTRVSV